jgi:integrase
MSGASEFMIDLARRFQEEKKLTETTANAYVRSLYMLNDRKPFKTLAFLTKLDEINAKLSKYADSTVLSIVGAIITTLNLYPENARYRKAMGYFRDRLKTRGKEVREKVESGEMTEKQKQNWIEWDKVLEKQKELEAAIAGIKPRKAIGETEWDNLQKYTLLSLYTMMAPRRNKDWLEMVVVNKLSDKLPKDKNYYAIKDGKVQFNVYKTSKAYGTQEFAVPEDLKTVLGKYLAHHPLFKDKRKAPNFPLLVAFDGSPFTAENTITRILNKIFGQKVGASMLRHIWLTSKYAKTVEGMKEDAGAMAHSTSMQRQYIKKGSPRNEIVGEEEPLGSEDVEILE